VREFFKNAKGKSFTKITADFVRAICPFHIPERMTDVQVLIVWYCFNLIVGGLIRILLEAFGRAPKLF
jgi:hypothetical protein